MFAEIAAASPLIHGVHLNMEASELDRSSLLFPDVFEAYSHDVRSDDDCVSFKPNSTNMLVYNMFCNGS